MDICANRGPSIGIPASATQNRSKCVHISFLTCVLTDRLSSQAEWGGATTLRMAKAKAGPVVTDNGNLLLDWTFDLMELKRKMSSDDSDTALWQAVNLRLLSLAGVVDTGLFVAMAKIAYFGDAKGNVIMLEPENSLNK